MSEEVERLKSELAEAIAARDDFFDSCDRYVKQIRELESKALTTVQRDRILTALGVGRQSPQYRRVKAALDQLMP